MRLQILQLAVTGSRAPTLTIGICAYKSMAADTPQSNAL